MLDFSSIDIKTILPDGNQIEELAEKIMLGSCLFGTLLTDSYSEKETKEIHQALKILCGKYDTHPFDTYGIYCYWDLKTKEILYIGLTNNLITRFSQHNNLGSKSSKGNKSFKIKEYLKLNEKIGFSLLLQPPLIHQEPNLFDKDNEVKVIESSLFQSFKNIHGKLPKWNEAEGTRIGRTDKLVTRYGDILDMINLEKSGYLNANSTIRELANNTEYQMFECDLNLVRAFMYQWKESFEKVVAKIIRWNEFMVSQGNFVAAESNIRLLNLIKSSYLTKKIKAL
ncbi:MAG: hypothetical protein GQ564_06465 [Bacteroidales bacterium]|nr:hypothetical protein [Bacteroidales bacterium]